MKFKKNDKVNLNVRFGGTGPLKTIVGVVKKVDGNHAELTVDCGNVEYTFALCDIIEQKLEV
jgi:transcription antitermination factor NusG